MSFSSRYSPKRIQPKLRSMPMRKTPSAVYIQMHQLANEKERLQQEIRMLSDRQQQILQRLQEIEKGLAQLETDATNYALQIDMPPEVLARAEAQAKQHSSIKSSSSQTKQLKPGDKYESMSIEY